MDAVEGAVEHAVRQVLSRGNIIASSARSMLPSESVERPSQRVKNVPGALVAHSLGATQPGMKAGINTEIPQALPRSTSLP